MTRGGSVSPSSVGGGVGVGAPDPTQPGCSPGPPQAQRRRPHHPMLTNLIISGNPVQQARKQIHDLVFLTFSPHLFPFRYFQLLIFFHVWCFFLICLVNTSPSLCRILESEREQAAGKSVSSDLFKRRVRTRTASVPSFSSPLKPPRTFRHFSGGVDFGWQLRKPTCNGRWAIASDLVHTGGGSVSLSMRKKHTLLQVSRCGCRRTWVALSKVTRDRLIASELFGSLWMNPLSSARFAT